MDVVWHHHECVQLGVGVMVRDIGQESVGDLAQCGEPHFSILNTTEGGLSVLDTNCDEIQACRGVIPFRQA